MNLSPSKTLQEAFLVAVDAASPRECLAPHLAELVVGDALVLGAGKAAASMAVAFNEFADGKARGLVVTRYGHGLRDGESAGNIEVIEAAHPLPDDAGVVAGKRMLDLASSIRENETLYFLVSGGGSSLCVAPLSGVSLEQKRNATDFLMRNGADIREINCVRRQLSSLKGGRLAEIVHPARVVTLAISDVPGNSLCDIASGPTVPNPTMQSDAIDVLDSYHYPAIEELLSVLSNPANESPNGGFEKDSARIIATSKNAMDAASSFLSEQGYEVRRLGDDIAANARKLGREHARLAIDLAGEGKKIALLSGGETTVVVSEKSGGRGGRNMEYLAAFALEVDGHENFCAIAADTDGIDGSSDAAGAWFDSNLDTDGLAESLENNDTHSFFQARDLLIETGPTRTNVNDFRLVLTVLRQAQDDSAVRKS